MGVWGVWGGGRDGWGITGTLVKCESPMHGLMKKESIVFFSLISFPGAHSLKLPITYWALG